MRWLFSAVFYLVVCVLASHATAQQPTTAPARATITVDAGQVLRQINPRLLGGTNIAAWTGAGWFSSPQVRTLIDDLRPGVIRLPGGSWGDAMFWNGNGVRRADGSVDPSRMGPDGYPAIDYSAYAPSIMAEQHKSIPRSDGWHGNVDVKAMHEFVERVPDAEHMVIVNAGTGRPQDAAEWVRWANKTMGWGVTYWEIGNELDGGWESGHVLPDGRELTAEMYAQRFGEFARAMKAVDPSIRIGGATSGTDNGGFSEVMLREVGDQVDFVSVHIYPGNPMYSDAEQFGRVRSAREAADRVKRWINRYQPDRADKIELGLTEWGLPDYRGTRDLYNALWSMLFLHESARSGFDLTNQWYAYDLVSGGLLAGDEQAYAPLSQYWGLWLWNHYTGDRLVAASQEGSESLRVLASASDDAVYLTLVNTDPENDAAASIRLRNFNPAPAAEKALSGSRQYFFDPLAKKIQWSTRPDVKTIPAGESIEVSVPPYSILALRVPSAAAPQLSELAQQSRDEPAVADIRPELRIVLPKEAYANEKVEGWVQALVAGTNQPYPGSLPSAAITASGEASLDRTHVRLSESVGRFFISAAAPGAVTVTVTAGGITAQADMTIKPSVPQPMVVWEFEQLETDREGYVSDWTLSADTSVRANQRVARIDVPEGPRGEKRNLLRIDRFPGQDKLNRGNIRGMFFDLVLGPSFACEDPNARVSVIMQSPADYWMYLGSVPLSQAREWKTHTFEVTQPKHLEAIPYVFNILFILDTAAPAKGPVYIDRVGLMVR